LQFELAETALSEMHPRICQLVNVVHDGDSLLSIPSPPSPLSNPIILNLISTYLLHILVVKTRPDKATSKSIEELASLLASPTTRSLLHWFPNFTGLPAKHTDYLLTRTYSTLTKLCSSFSTTPNKSDSKLKVQIPSPESLFILRTYALRCLCHTSPGVIQAGTFWDQATSFAATLAKASQKSSEDRATRLVLDAYSEIASLAMKRSDGETFAGVNVKGFLAFCDSWTSFAKRVSIILTSIFLTSSFIGRRYLSSAEHQYADAAARTHFLPKATRRGCRDETGTGFFSYRSSISAGCHSRRHEMLQRLCSNNGPPRGRGKARKW